MTSNFIDFHFHYIPEFYRDAMREVGGRTPAVGFLPDWSPQLALELMDQRGIRLAIMQLTQPGVAFMPDGRMADFARRCNEYAAQLIADFPERFGCFGALPMHDMDAAIAEARRCLEEFNFEGVSMSSSYGERLLSDPAFAPLMEYLDSRQAVVHVHPGLLSSSTKPVLTGLDYPFETTRTAVSLLLSGALERFPRIRFVLSHGGGTLPYVSFRLSVTPMIDKRMRFLSRAEVYAGLRSFWYDTALAAAPEQIDSLSRIAAEDRIVFGSDWPFCTAPVVAEEIGDLSAPDFLSADQLTAIASHNALKLFPRRAAQFATIATS